jgi:hypothetical protein
MLELDWRTPIPVAPIARAGETDGGADVEFDEPRARPAVAADTRREKGAGPRGDWPRANVPVPAATRTLAMLARLPAWLS